MAGIVLRQHFWPAMRNQRRYNIFNMILSLIIRNTSNFDVLTIFTMQALEYLSKVDVYRGMGFAEQRIHEAYSKSKGDWDKVLDLLVQGR
jgi:hypothetical protein